MICLTPEQYWEWRTTIAEMDIAKRDVQIVQQQGQILALQNNLSLMKVTAKHEAATAEYARVKKVLEDAHGVSLNDKIIDDRTFEIKEIPKEADNGAG